MAGVLGGRTHGNTNWAMFQRANGREYDPLGTRNQNRLWVVDLWTRTALPSSPIKRASFPGPFSWKLQNSPELALSRSRLMCLLIQKDFHEGTFQELFPVHRRLLPFHLTELTPTILQILLETPWISLTFLKIKMPHLYTPTVLYAHPSESTWPIVPTGFPGGTVIKNPPASAGNAGDSGSIPGSERSREGNGNPLQYSCLEYPRRSLAGYSPWLHKG